MTPVRLSHVWYRRFYMALFVLSLGYIIPYILQILEIVPKGEYSVDIFTVICSGIAAVASVVLFFLGEKVTSFLPAFVAYAAYGLATALLVQGTGGVASPFLALWALVAFVAPVFGAYGWLPALVVTGGAIAEVYISGELTSTTFTTILLTSFVPLVAGSILWRETGTVEDTSTKNVKNLANQLSEVAAKSEIVINAIGDGVIAVDGKGVIQLINPAAQEILGWGKQDALMLSYKSILKLSNENNTELDPMQDPIQQVLNTNQQTRGNKLIALTNSGKKIGVSLVVSPIGDPGSGAIAVFRDVTNERAEEREQAEFISTASHEMRTPVASIEGYLGLALNPNTASIDARAKDFILKAHEAAQHLGRLFQDLLDVSKSEDGRMQSTPRVLDIVPFTDIIIQGLNQKAIDKGLTLTFVPTAASGSQRKIMPVYFVNLDNDHIREVLDNLIDNAIKYTPQGEVRVDVEGSDDKVVISIKDTGLGIPTEDIPHLFQKFYRVSNMDRQSIGGTGLGLYLCRRLVEAMQGRLWVESVFGHGSTFFVELPRISNEEAERLRSIQAQQFAQTPSPVVPAEPAPAPQAPAPQAAAPTVTQIPVTIAEPAIPQTPVQAAPQVTQATPPTARPATTVPRGETLTREQINERVRQLEALAQQQRTPPPTR